jgi:hypothetical protein
MHWFPKDGVSFKDGREVWALENVLATLGELAADKRT